MKQKYTKGEELIGQREILIYADGYDTGIKYQKDKCRKAVELLKDKTEGGIFSDIPKEHVLMFIDEVFGDLQPSLVEPSSTTVQRTEHFIKTFTKKLMKKILIKL